ncbi:CDP-diacylglycerol diphosphatase [Mycobacterium paraterrae]|uniref:CDP-diacylglycerol diphosphatase n=1 Tax=Mycobacterium paraterrae TaxID=577492 RepID=A0ABY3VVF5_9MYCO|nr:CDP-diacylglycerol diphosphatase [Mycobacterium paraterrae]UMB72039.1 CDP-diacylglycerol diphosphatase [Mycobacterium paraterrae]
MIWDGVKAASPSDFKGNVDVVFPTGEPSRGYALHNGKPVGTANPYDFLLVPTIRETGIECSNLVNDNPPEYFNDAYNYVASAPKGLPKGTDWALGIESGDPGARSFNQLHIHVSRLRTDTRNSLNKVAKSCGANESQWLQSKIVVNTERGDRTFRCWNAGVMTHNFFGKLNDNIVKPLKVSMSNESLLITANPAGGFFVLSSDHVGPDLNKHGVNNIEGLLNKG